MAVIIISQLKNDDKQQIFVEDRSKFSEYIANLDGQQIDLTKIVETQGLNDLSALGMKLMKDEVDDSTDVIWKLQTKLAKESFETKFNIKK